MQTVRQLGGTLGIAVIGAVVIAADGETPGQTAAPSGIAAGFWVAAVAFALAALVGATLLARRDTPVLTGTVKLPASRDPSLGSG